MTGHPTERGAVLDMAWAVTGGAVRLSLHLAEPLGEYELQRLAVAVREVEALVSLLDAHRDPSALTAADILAAE
jgi:hypothetical protein